MVVIDTSAWIFALKKRYHPYVKKRVEELLDESDIGINGIIALELLGGCRTEREYKRLKERLDALHYIETGKPLWDDASRLAFALKRKGVSVPCTDLLIAATALHAKAPLLHADHHFDVIAEHAGLKVESLVERIR